MMMRKILSPLRQLIDQIHPLRRMRAGDWRLIGGVALFIWGWFIAYALLAYTPSYNAGAMVIIKDSAFTQPYVISDQGEPMQTTSSKASNPVLNMMGLLKGGALMDALWDFFRQAYPEELRRLKIRTEEDWQAFYGDGTSLIKAKNLPGTDLIAIQFKWETPEIAQNALKVLLDAFQHASLNLNRAEERSRSAFLDTQVRNLTRELEGVRQQKNAFRRQMKTISIDQERDDLAHARVELETRLNDLLSQSKGKLAERNRYQTMLGLKPTEALTAAAIGQNATMTKLTDQYYALLENKSFLRANLTENNPKVLELQAQIDQVERDIQRELRRTVGVSGSLAAKHPTPALADAARGTTVTQMTAAHAEAAGYHAVARGVQERLKQVTRQIAALPTVEGRLASLEQRERILSQALDTLYEKKLEAQLREAGTLSNVFVVDAPRRPLAPGFPTRSHLIVLGLVMGLVGGFLANGIKRKLSSSPATALPSPVRA